MNFRCPKCNTPLEEGTNKCPNCGTVVHNLPNIIGKPPHTKPPGSPPTHDRDKDDRIFVDEEDLKEDKKKKRIH